MDIKITPSTEERLRGRGVTHRDIGQAFLNARTGTSGNLRGTLKIFAEVGRGKICVI